MIKVISANGYDYYKSDAKDRKTAQNNREYYNLVKEGDTPPSGGYYDSDIICSIKNVPNLFK